MIYKFSLCHVTRLLFTIEFEYILIWCFFLFCKNTPFSCSRFLQEQNYLSIHSTNIPDQSKERFVVRMFSSKFFIKDFKTFSTKLNDDVPCFSRCH